MHACATGGIFSLGTIKRCAKISSLKCLETNLKDKFLKYEKSESLIWNFVSRKIMARKFFFKTCVPTLQEVFFLTQPKDAQRTCISSDYSHNWNKKSLKDGESEKLAFEFSIWEGKWQICFYFLIKTRARATEDEFFPGYNQKLWKREFFK